MQLCTVSLLTDLAPVCAHRVVCPHIAGSVRQVQVTLRYTGYRSVVNYGVVTLTSRGHARGRFFGEFIPASELAVAVGRGIALAKYD